MMDNLREYLLGNTSPEMYDLLRNAHEALVRNGQDNMDDLFESILMSVDQVALGQPMDEIVAGFTDLLRASLEAYGIIAVDDAPISVLVSYLNGMSDILVFDDPKLLLQTSMLEVNPQECLAELFALCSGENVEDMMVSLSEVSAALITKIRELGTTGEESEFAEDELAQQKEHAHALTVFCNFINTNTLRTTEMIANGAGVGYPFLVYANQIGRDFETIPPLQAAHELIAMALISKEGLFNPQAVIKANIDKFVADVDVITRIDIIITDILVRMNR